MFQLIASRHILWCVKNCKLRKPPFVKAGVPLAFVMAVGGIGLEDVAIAAFQLFQNAAFIDGSGPNIISESRKNIFVTSIFLIQLAEFGIVTTKKSISLAFTVLPACEMFSTLNDMTIAYRRPVLWLMKRFKFFIISTARSNSGSSMNDRFAFAVGVAATRVSNAIKNIRIFSSGNRCY